MPSLPVKSYRLTKKTLEKLAALRDKLRVRYDATVIEMAVKRMVEQEQVEKSQTKEKFSN